MNPPPAVELHDVGKRYRTRDGHRWAVRHLDLVVPRGSMYGLLGRNGAGKSTALRMILGLAAHDEGRIAVFGEPCPERLPLVVDRVGAVLDGPTLEPAFSGRRNLEVLARLRGIPRGRVDDVLELVGLAQRAHDQLASYSLGMRHRLAMGAALLGEPGLLVLDEPTNGLDPAGVVELRDLLRVLRAEWGTAVLLSSHQLAEVGAICDRVAILHGGRIRAQGPPADLAGDGSGPALESAFLELTRD